MSDATHPSPAPNTPGTNGLGLAGFIVSLLGILGTCGLLSPVGLIMSAFAMRKEPKGFAIAGLVIGIVGTLTGVIGIIFFGVVFLGIIALAGAGIALSADNLQTWDSMNQTAEEIEAYYETMNTLPESLETITTMHPELGTDAWGNSFIYTIQGDNAFALTSAGEDALPQTNDDIRLEFDLD